PSGGHVQIDLGLRPSNPEKTSVHRDEAGPSKLPRTGFESNNLDATCNGFSSRTNNRLSTRTREGAVLAPRKPLAVAEADQWSLQWRLVRWIPTRRRVTLQRRMLRS